MLGKRPLNICKFRPQVTTHWSHGVTHPKSYWMSSEFLLFNLDSLRHSSKIYRFLVMGWKYGGEVLRGRSQNGGTDFKPWVSILKWSSMTWMIWWYPPTDRKPPVATQAARDPLLPHRDRSRCRDAARGLPYLSSGQFFTVHPLS